jgi:hypothetical protein
VTFSSIQWKTLAIGVERVAWAAMLIALPLTSFPYFPRAIGGEALVRPLSLYPLLFLLFFSVFPQLFRKTLPKNVLALMTFVLVAVTASILSLLKGIEPALGISVASRVLRGIFTLGIGCAFFITIASLPVSGEDLRFSLRWIYAGVAIAMTWGTCQAYNILFPNSTYFDFLQRVQVHLSTRKLLPDRISGMTYEPHWFAEQIIVLLLPYALSAIINNYTVFNWRWKRVTVEWLLLIWAICLLPFTFSRAGLLNLIAVLFFGMLLFAFKNLRSRQISAHAKRIRLETRLGLVGAVLVLAGGSIYFIGSRNSFFARMWDYWKKPGANIEEYMTYIGFDARLIYAQAAFNTYKAHPLLGVGLGNYAFYFEDMLPYRPIAEVPEILLMITPEMGRDRLITAKNFYLRILAETGIMGAVTFGVFLLVDFGYALYLWLSPEKEWSYWGTASICGLIAFALSAFTFDSFVIPNMWVLLGLITATTRLSTRAELLFSKYSQGNYEPLLEPS